MDITRIVLAEDDMNVATGLRTVLERAGGYQVWVVKRRADIMDTLTESGASWLILDLELMDGNSLDIVPELKKKFEDKLIIIAMTGFFERFSEQQMLKQGVDISLRKPYEPTALLLQMSRLRDRLEGIISRPPAGSCIQIGSGGIVNLRTGIFEHGDDRVILTEPQRQLLSVLASSAGPEKKWNSIDRGVLMVYIWGDSAALDPYAAGNRLRKLVQRIRELLSHDVIKIDRGTNHSARYSLHPEVKPCPEEIHA